MAQETSLRVGVDSRPAEQGVRRARGALKGLQTEARKTETAFDRLQNSLGGFRTLFAGIGVGLAVREFGQLVDAATTIDNRLKLVTNTGEQVNAVFDELVQISNETRTGLRENADLFNRLALSTKELGLTFNEQLDLTRRLNQALVISGASAAEGGAGLIQLSQGLAAGALRGDELRSVLENLPKVADVIAKEFGVTRGELRKLGEEGLITADRVVAAFQKAGPELDELFGRITPTISSAFTVLNNKALEFVRGLNQGVGIGGIFANLILKLADNFNVLASAAAGAAVIIGGVLVKAVAKFTIALASNPIGLLITAVGALTVAIGVFGDKTFEVAGMNVTGWQMIEAAVMTTWEFVRPVFQAWGEAFAAVGAAASAFAAQFEIDLKGTGTFLKQWASVVTGIMAAVPKTIVELFKNIPASLELIFKSAINAILATAEFLINGFAKTVARVGDLVEIFDEEAGRRIKANIEDTLSVDLGRLPITDEAQAVGRALGAIWEDAFRTDRLDNFGASYERNLKKVVTSDLAAAASADVLNQKLAEGNAIKKESNELDKEREKFQKRIQSEFDRLRESTGRAQEVLQEWVTTQRSELERLGLENTKFADMVEEIYANRLPEARRKDLFAAKDSASGIKQAMVEYVEAVGTAADQSREFFTNMFQDMEDALVGFVRNGKLDFRSLIDSMIDDLIRLGIQQAATAAFSSFGGIGGIGGVGGAGGGGGIGGIVTSLIGGLFKEGGLSNSPVSSMMVPAAAFKNAPHFQDGGISGGGIPAVLHDDEAVIPLSRGREIPVKMQGDQGKGDTIINYNISTPDADSFRRSQDQITARASRGLQRANRRNN